MTSNLDTLIALLLNNLAKDIILHRLCTESLIGFTKVLIYLVCTTYTQKTSRITCYGLMKLVYEQM